MAKLDKFAYDLDDQVTEARYNVDEQHSTQDRLCSYDYDPAGNRNTMTDNGTPTNYTVNDLNQYTAAGTSSMDYDLNGNLTHQGVWTYVYDAQNRLVSAISSSQQVDFAYDPRNRCLSRTSSTAGIQGPTTFFYYDGWELIEEHDANRQLLAQYIHGVREDEMIAKIDSYGTVYYHTDAEGSVAALTDTSGNVIERYKYDAFGKATILDPSSLVTRPSSLFGNRFLFTGREWLPDLGLYDYRNRVYSPELGRFLQTDPKSFDADPSNLYRYCGNEPLDRVDPMGLEDDTKTGKVLVDSGNQQAQNDTKQLEDDVRRFIQNVRPEASKIEPQKVVEDCRQDAQQARQDMQGHPERDANGTRHASERHYVEVVSSDGKQLERKGPAVGGRSGAPLPDTGGKAPLTSSHGHGPDSPGAWPQKNDIPVANGKAPNPFKTPWISGTASTGDKRVYIYVPPSGPKQLEARSSGTLYHSDNNRPWVKDF